MKAIVYKTKFIRNYYEAMGMIPPEPKESPKYSPIPSARMKESARKSTRGSASGRRPSVRKVPSARKNETNMFKT